MTARETAEAVFESMVTTYNDCAYAGDEEHDVVAIETAIIAERKVERERCANQIRALKIVFALAVDGGEPGRGPMMFDCLTPQASKLLFGSLDEAERRIRGGY